MKYSDVARGALPDCIGPPLKEMGFDALARLRWRRGHAIELRVIIDSKAMDPYRGGAFTLEVEVSATGDSAASCLGPPGSNSFSPATSSAPSWQSGTRSPVAFRTRHRSTCA